jgi:hypothetical protein
MKPFTNSELRQKTKEKRQKKKAGKKKAELGHR